MKYLIIRFCFAITSLYKTNLFSLVFFFCFSHSVSTMDSVMCCIIHRFHNIEPKTKNVFWFIFMVFGYVWCWTFIVIFDSFTFFFFDECPRYVISFGVVFTSYYVCTSGKIGSLKQNNCVVRSANYKQLKKKNRFFYSLKFERNNFAMNF